MHVLIFFRKVRMSTTLDPNRLRCLLKSLHSEFPGVDYATLVRAVMQVECTSNTSENLEAYCTRVREAIKVRPEAMSNDGIRRSAKIFLQRPLEQMA